MDPAYNYIPSESEIPALYSQESLGPDAIVHIKLFSPEGRLTLYLTEYDPKDDMAFGFTVSALGPDCDEMGSMSLPEIQRRHTSLGLRIERDINWTPRPLREIPEYREKNDLVPVPAELLGRATGPVIQTPAGPTEVDERDRLVHACHQVLNLARESIVGKGHEIYPEQCESIEILRNYLDNEGLLE